MLRKNIDSGWELHTGSRGIGTGFGQPAKPQIIVNLPHDYAVETETDPDSPANGANGFYRGHLVTYTKKIDIPEAWSGQRIMLEIDGAYQNSEVSVNGHLAARRPYGYAPYHADLTEFIRYGQENEISIAVNNTAVPNTRWYSGCGLYRHVDILHGSSLHIAPWGIFARTESVADGDAALLIDVKVENHTVSLKHAKIRVTVLDADGAAILTGDTLATVPAGESGTGSVRLLLENANLWDLDIPYLYTVRAEIIESGSVSDCDETAFGVRTISVDSKRGFRLNGRSVKLKGGCIHHDNGILGSAAFDVAEYRKVFLHKQNGFNALRSAHNPPSRGLLNACDRLGILVMDEAFDMWNAAKNPNDYHLYFAEWWTRDIDAMVLRDRNHPSVIMWSIGNEIPEHDGRSDGWFWSQRLAARVRSLDNTRFVTSAVNNIEPPHDQMMKILAEDIKNGGSFFNGPGMQQYNRDHFFELTDGYTAPLDVVGYNYIDYLYEQTIEKYPHRVLCGTESFPLETDLQWALVERLPNLIGDFTWTSFDYIGEAGIGRVAYTKPDEPKPMVWGGPYPWRLASDADFDICGFDRPQLHYRRIVWGSDETYIAVRNPKNNGMNETVSLWGWPEVHNSWTWHGYEGSPIAVDVYSSADEVELIISGVSLGRKPAGKANRFKAAFNAVYAPGAIEAVSYKDGREVSRDTLVTAREPASIRLIPEKLTLAADDQDLCYIAVEVVDRNGLRVPNASVELSASVSGTASLAGFGSARPDTTENYTTGKYTSYDGRLLAVLRAGEIAGETVLTVTSKELGSSSVTINAYNS